MTLKDVTSNKWAVSFWVLAVTGWLAAIRLMFQPQPTGSTILGLLVMAGFFVVLGVSGKELIWRIRRIGPGGIEVETWTSIERILSVPQPPLPKLSFADPMGPWTKVALKREQIWFYERGTYIIFHFQHRGVEPETLSKTDLEKYRQLIAWVGAAALNFNVIKALDILRLLEPIDPKKPEELFHLGQAYLLAYQIEGDPEKRKPYLEKSSQYFQEASRKDEKNTEIFWSLAWIYDELGLYGESVKANQRTVELDSRWAPWAYWVMAVSLLKQGEKDTAIKALGSVTTGAWWEQIWKDPELQNLKTDERFEALYKERRTKDGET